jgi:hypothetical protein
MEKKYYSWTIIEELPHRKRGFRMIKAQCECGHQKEMRLYDLVAGFTKRCRSCSIKELKRRRGNEKFMTPRRGKLRIRILDFNNPFNNFDPERIE